MGVCVLYQICAGWIIPSTEGNSGCWRSRTFFPRSKRGPGLSVSTWRIHIQVVQRHRKFLRFAFRGKAYQYMVLPFGLALAPRMFTKCMYAALALLRLQGIQILNYLDDWLILASSREQVIRHRDSLHLRELGLRLNGQKIVLTPAQQTTFLEVCLDSTSMQAHLGPARVESIQSCTARFRLGRLMSVGLCCRLLGLLAEASPVPLGLLHTRPFLWWKKSMGIRPSWPSLRLLRVSGACLRALLVWQDPNFLRRGVSMGVVCHHQMTDASVSGWGAAFEGRPACGVWSGRPVWFPPVKLIPAVLCRVKTYGVRLLLEAPFCPSQTWFSELVSLLEGDPLEIPVRKDLLCQLQGRIWHPRPEIWKLWVWTIIGRP